jgi:predicted nucleotidyltransferase
LPFGLRLLPRQSTSHNPDMLRPQLEPILRELSEALRDRYRERYVGLWLYGSQARGDAGPESDIDVLLILTRSERPAVEVDRYVDILADLNLRSGVLLSVLPVEESALRDASGPFWRNVRAEGIAA